MVDKTVEENIEIATEITITTEAGKGPKKGHFPEIMAITELITPSRSNTQDDFSRASSEENLKANHLKL